MSQDDLYINGELLRLGREARGWVIGDMATRACMSVKQIRQLEEGGTSAFYSPAVKMTSAKKLVGILELSPEQVFNRPGTFEAETVPAQAALADEPHTEDQPATTEAAAHAQPAVVIETPAHVEESTSAAAPEEPKGKTSVWAIAALFVTAIGVAAYMHQQEEPVTEPPPPLQVLPAEAESAASAASAADAAASNASAPSAPSAATDRAAAPAASSPVVAASTTLPSAVPAPAASRPAASTASKPL
jgi:transcriptional regulator with XRE-family HTH domain